MECTGQENELPASVENGGWRFHHKKMAKLTIGLYIRLPFYILVALYLLTSGCNINEPKEEPVHEMDNALIGIWTDQNTPSQKAVITYYLDSSGRFQCDYIEHFSAGDFVSQDLGTWYTNSDTLVIYSQYHTWMPDGNGWSNFSSYSTVKSIYRIDDSGDFCIRGSNGIKWSKYHRKDSTQTVVPVDTSSFSVSLPDTIVPVLDTVIFWAQVKAINDTVQYYIWSFGVDTSQSSVTTTEPWVKNVYAVADTGNYVGSIRAVSTRGKTTKTDYFGYKVDLFRPVIKVGDTLFNFNDQRVIHLNGMDKNGKVDKYYISNPIKGFPILGESVYWKDSIDADSNFIRFPADTGYPVHFYIKARDDDGFFSKIDTFVVDYHPYLCYGSKTYEQGMRIAQSAAGRYVVGGIRANSTDLGSFTPRIFLAVECFEENGSIGLSDISPILNPGDSMLQLDDVDFLTESPGDWPLFLSFSKYNSGGTHLTPYTWLPAAKTAEKRTVNPVYGRRYALEKWPIQKISIATIDDMLPYSSDTSLHYFYLVQFDQQGNELRSKKIDCIDSRTAYGDKSLLALSSRELLVVSGVQMYSLDTALTIQWTKQSATPIKSLLLLSDGSIAGFYQSTMQLFDNTGNLLSTVTVPTSPLIKVLNYGTANIIGLCSDKVVSLTYNGGLVWQYGFEFSSRGQSSFADIAVDDGGGFIITGNTTEFGSGSKDIFIGKIGLDGKRVW